MRKNIFRGLLIVWLACTTANFAQATHSVSNLKFLTKRIVNIGNVSSDTVACVLFRFQNTGTSILTITDLQKSCNCTETILDKTTYEPGEQGELTLKIETQGKIGANCITCVMITNTPQQEYVLRVDMNVLQDKRP